MSAQWLGSSRWVSRIPAFARRAFQADQMEFDSALSQMYSLCTQPSLVSKMSKARKMTKNYYHRDDPAFLVLQLFFIVVCTVAYTLATSGSLLSALTTLSLYNIVLYGLWAAMLATVTRSFAHRYLQGAVALNEVRRDIDWRYALDVHCNGYFTYFMWSKVVPYFLLVFYSPDSFISRFTFNMFFATGCATYLYNTFLGYLELPSLTRQQMIMYPVPVLFVIIGVASLRFHFVSAFLPV